MADVHRLKKSSGKQIDRGTVCGMRANIDQYLIEKEPKFKVSCYSSIQSAMGDRHFIITHCFSLSRDLFTDPQFASQGFSCLTFIPEITELVVLFFCQITSLLELYEMALWRRCFEMVIALFLECRTHVW